MVVPMTAWMRIRGRSWRDGAEMAVAMLGPVAVILALSRVGLSDTLPWHSNSEHTAMLLGMLAIMLYRREHYTGSTPSSAGQVVRDDRRPVHALPKKASRLPRPLGVDG